jgi:hypothetical protein
VTVTQARRATRTQAAAPDSAAVRHAAAPPGAGDSDSAVTVTAASLALAAS